MIRRVVAISGWKGSGKDTSAERFEAEHGFVRRSFAARLKNLVSETYNIPRHVLDDPRLKEEPILHLPAITTDPFTQDIHEKLKSELVSGYWTPRALCILEGSVKRAVSANYWVRSVAEEILDRATEKFVISDLRYQSEIETLQLLLPYQITTIRIERFTTVNTQDPSERNLDNYPFDHVLHNRGSIGELYEQIDDLMADSLVSIDDARRRM